MDQEQILREWLDKINDGNEEQVDKYLNTVLQETVESSIKDGYEEVFKPGSSLSCSLSFLVKKGHYEITQQVLKKVFNNDLSDTAIRNFARASRLPDLLHFENLEYHAQSHTKDNGDLADFEQEANIEKFVNFLKRQLQELDISIDENNEEAVFYYMGVLLHAVQDLACHQGMTDCEHSTYDAKGQSPDKDERRYGFGYLLTKKFIEQHLLNRVLRVKHLLNQTEEIKWKNFSRIKTLSSLAWSAFKFKYFYIESIGDSNSMRWFTWYSNKHNESACEEIKINIFDKVTLQ